MALVQQVATKHHVDGITISGGEPFEQADELAVLLGELGKEYEDILVYSGYTYGQLVGLGQNAVDAVLDNIAVLIDGEYREDRNQGHPLKGSENQRIHYMKPECREKYEMYIEEMYGKKRVQNFPIQGGVFSVGIHESRFEERLSEGLQRQGILKRKEE